MLWDVALLMTKASDGSPRAGVRILEASAEGKELASTDESGAATVTLDVEDGVSNALCISPVRFSIRREDQTNAVTILDETVSERLKSGLPPLDIEQTEHWKIKYEVTDRASGAVINGVPVMDPLTGAQVASNPTIDAEVPVVRGSLDTIIHPVGTTNTISIVGMDNDLTTTVYS